MPLLVQKYGGTSVADPEKILRAARRAIAAHRQGSQVVVVVSAGGDATDDLIAMARQISDRPPARELDMLLATGEQVSVALMAIAIESLGVPAISFTAAQIGILTDSLHTRARIREISTEPRLSGTWRGQDRDRRGLSGCRSERGDHDPGPRWIGHDRRGIGGRSRGRCLRGLH